LTVKHHARTVLAVQEAAGGTQGSTEHDGGADRDLATGFLLGLLVGEGHFGGDGRQPQVTLRMHVRHEETFEWLRRTYPGSRLYGPYHHGGRSYFQWSARGRYLRDQIVPLVERHRALLDEYTAARFDTMCERYRIERPPSEAAPSTIAPAGSDPAPSGG
jgi:hypothetical protein